MAIREVLKMGDPRLLAVAEPVSRFDTPELDGLLADMRDTMHALQGAGLAAPQIGVGLRVVIFGGESIPYTVLVNPVLSALDDEVVEGWEGCLSVPGMRGLVPRLRRLRYSGSDEHGHPIDRSVEDFHARVVQHEVDHLDGVLYPRRIKDLRQFGFSEALFPGEALADD